MIISAVLDAWSLFIIFFQYILFLVDFHYLKFYFILKCIHYPYIYIYTYIASIAPKDVSSTVKHKT